MLDDDDDDDPEPQPELHDETYYNILYGVSRSD